MSASSATGTIHSAPVRNSPQASDARRSGRRGAPLSLVLGAVLLAVVLVALVCALADWHPSTAIGAGPRLGAPSSAHPVGTDRLGRDVLGLSVEGTVDAVLVAVGVAALAGSLGAVTGMLAAATTRALDAVLAGVVDLLIAFPTILLAMLVVTVQGASRRSVVLALGISGAGLVARTTRVTASRVLRADYVTAARTLGTSRAGILLRHVLPAVAPTLATQVTLVASGAVLSAASLSYLGLGSPPTELSWGRLLQDAQTTVAAQPWGAVVPGVSVVVLVLGLGLMADGVREIADPTVEADR